MKPAEYNELTKKLLEEGYTALNYPANVEIGRTCPDRNNPLNNFDGGFTYHRWWIYQQTFKTPCGLQCEGRHVHTGLSVNGTEFIYENDLGTIHCPYHKTNCEMKHEGLPKEGVISDWCNVHLVNETYQYEGSVEGIQKLRDDEIEREKISFNLQHNGHTCENHMHYDKDSEKWKMHYNPYKCGICKCTGNFGRVTDDNGIYICPILGRPLDKKKGNVYYDIRTRYRRYDLDGTLFEGQIDTHVEKGIRLFEYPVSMDIARNVAKLCKDEIIWKVKSKYHQELFFHERYGRYFELEVLNIRAEQKESRDLLQDLQDIQAGIKITHASDSIKNEKVRKSENRQKVLEKRRKAAEKRILKIGYCNMDTFEQNRMCKLLAFERIDELEAMREERLSTQQLELPLDKMM